MTTNCDLEEMKHIAQQKFIELVDSGVKWEKRYFCSGGSYFAYKDFEAGSTSVTLKNTTIWSDSGPRERKAKKNKDGSYNKQDVTRAKKEHAKALEEYNALPMVKAIQTLKDRHDAAEREKQCLKMQKALESSCKALQEALKDTATTLAPEVQTGNTEPYTKPEGHADTPSVGEWFVIRYGGSEMEVCILEVRDDVVKWGKPSWLVSGGIWLKTWEFKERVLVSLGMGTPRRWGWWRLTTRDLFFPYSRPKP